jgi:CTP:molybdopterin cytidylyltransferase MocA
LSARKAGARPRRVAAIVLAAGAASRFGSPKALAQLQGRPMLQHVLDSLAAAGLTEVVVVLGAAADHVESAIAWRQERRVRNPAPERGLASSLGVGLTSLSLDVDAALVALGDQPRLRPEVVREVVGAWRRTGRPIAVARYPRDGAPNPVLLDRSMFERALALEGDRGMGPLIRSSPDLVTEVAVAGDNPDVDTPADLARLAKGSAPRRREGAP